MAALIQNLGPSPKLGGTSEIWFPGIETPEKGFSGATVDKVTP